jgi:amidophosphoribosyltransferase
VLKEDYLDKPREECGVVGVRTSNDGQAARRAYWALQALQHRGQEAAGISSWKNGEILTHKETGLVTYVFKENDLEYLESDLAIGHVRYSTTGSSTKCNAQPVVYKGSRREVALSHNGNLVNAGQLRQELEEQGYQFNSSTDSEVIAALVACFGDSPFQGLEYAMSKLHGAYSLTILSENQLLACRDPKGVRPLVLGVKQKSYVVASETCALDLLEVKYLRDVAAGEIILIDQNGLQGYQAQPPSPRPCSFEAIYFSRPDSRLGSETVYNIRLRLGKELAYEAPQQADLVTAIPDSGHAMAVGFAQASKIDYEDVFIKNRYVNRTFIEPNQEDRRRSILKKFNPMPSVVTGRKLIVVDDSLIRGNTLLHIIHALRTAGADQIHIRIASPPTRFPCHYGIDMGSEGDYIASDLKGNERSSDEICELIGADSLHYLSFAGLSRALQRSLNQRCTACFTGDYPIDPEEAGRTSMETSSVGDPCCESKS